MRRGVLIELLELQKRQDHAAIAVHRHRQRSNDGLGFDQRDAMIADDPGTYYLKPHYENYECVLVRLAKVDRGALADLLHAAWRFVDKTAPRGRRPSTPRRRNSRRRNSQLRK